MEVGGLGEGNGWERSGVAVRVHGVGKGGKWGGRSGGGVGGWWRYRGGGERRIGRAGWWEASGDGVWGGGRGRGVCVGGR